MNHVMIDIETLGTAPTSIFLSIGAVAFSLDPPVIGSSFYDTVTLESAQEAGLTFTPSTLKWWMTQDGDVRKKMFEGKRDLREVLEGLSMYLHHIEISTGKPVIVWGNSASFDLGILGNAYRTLKMDLPWSFRNERCYRTLVSEFPDIGKVNFEGRPHDPVADCIYQIRRLQRVWKVISKDTFDKEKFLQAINLLREIAANNSPALSSYRNKLSEFVDIINRPIYSFEKPENNS